eukprot:2091856-Pleurochrysis_carterae.AAC.3
MCKKRPGSKHAIESSISAPLNTGHPPPEPVLYSVIPPTRLSHQRSTSPSDVRLGAAAATVIGAWAVSEATSEAASASASSRTACSSASGMTAC